MCHLNLESLAFYTNTKKNSWISLLRSVFSQVHLKFNMNITRIHPIPQCSTLRNWFRPRNQFPPIPGISSHQFHQFPEFRPIPSNTALTQFQESVPIPFGLNSGISGIRLIRNQLKLRQLNRIPELRGIPGNQWEFIGTEFRELDGTGSVDGTDYAMFNIAE